jgi:uncharacterized membrane protein
MTSIPLPARPAIVSLRRLWERRKNMILTGIAVSIFAFVSHAILAGQGNPPVRVAVDVSPLAAAPLVLQLHIGAAISALLIGAVLFIGVKGRTFHRVFGYAWITAMMTTAISSLFLTGLNGDAYSPIHLLSGLTMVAVPMGLAAARGRRIAAHRKYMTGIFVQGMLIAGLFTLLPGRFMWSLFFTT